MRVLVAGGTSTSPGGWIAVRAVAEYLASCSARSTLIVPSGADMDGLPRGPRYRARGRAIALAQELVGLHRSVDVYIGMADRLPLIRRRSTWRIMIAQNPHLYRGVSPSSTRAGRLLDRFRVALAVYSANHADAVVTATRATASELAARCRVEPGRVSVVPIPAVGIDRQRGVHRDVIQRIAMVGAARSYKRFEWAIREIDAWAAMRPETVKIEHYGPLYGDGPAGALRRAAETTSSVAVELHGQVGHSEVIAGLADADLFVFPSRTESYGVPLVEALSIGVPTICSDIPQFREIGGSIPVYIDGSTGSLAEALAAVEPRGVREALSRASRTAFRGASGWNVLSGGATNPRLVRDQSGETQELLG